MLVGVDVVGEGNCSIQIAFNQNDKSTFNDNAGFSVSTGVTIPYFVQIDDTVPGEPLAIPCNAPSYSPVLTFTGSTSTANAWTWQAMQIYFAPAPSGAAGATG
jgi:acetyltransferase-like isoleucine patch superfamily enzyme